jgi:hypothetical protein
MTREQFVEKYKFQPAQDYGSAMFDVSEQMFKDLEAVINVALLEKYGQASTTVQTETITYPTSPFNE